MLNEGWGKYRLPNSGYWISCGMIIQNELAMPLFTAVVMGTSFCVVLERSELLLELSVECMEKYSKLNKKLRCVLQYL